MPKPLNDNTTRIYEGNHLHPDVFDRIRDDYLNQSGYTLVYADAEGNLIYGMPDCVDFPCLSSCRDCRKRVLLESIQAASPCVDLCQKGHALWGVPLYRRNRWIGGLIVTGVNLDYTSGLQDKQQIQTDLEGLVALVRSYRIPVTPGGNGRASSKTLSLPVETHFPINSYFFERLNKNLDNNHGELSDAVRQREWTRVRALIDNIWGMVEKCETSRLDMVKGFAIQLSMGIAKTAMAEADEQHNFQGLVYDMSCRIIYSQTPAQIVENLYHLIDILARMKHPSGIVAHAHLIDDVLTYLEKNYQESLSRATVAKKFGVSASHLSHLLKEKTGRTFSEFITRYRLEAASQLLINTDHSIVDVANEAGFCDQSYLAKIFRKYKGCSPADFRRRYQKR